MRVHERRESLSSLAPERAVTAPAGPGLVIGRTGDRAEGEADRAADEIVDGGRDARLSTTRGSGGSPVDDETAQGIAAARRGGVPLGRAARAPFEAAYGTDLTRVRLHTGRRASELCDDVQARAFTVGSDIFFRGGRPDPTSRGGRRLLAHEVAHAAQQDPGVIRRSQYLGGPQNWETDTTMNRPGTTTRMGRSWRMRRIDSAVARVRDAYQRGRVPILDRELDGLQRAIVSWRARPPAGAAHVRKPYVDALALEREGLKTDVTNWLDQYDETIEKARQNQFKARQWVQDGLNANTDGEAFERGMRLRNACQWFASRKLPLYILTATPDGAYRAQLKLRKATRADVGRQTAYFPNPENGTGAYHQAPGTYNRDNALNDPNILIHKVTNAWRKRGYVAITDTVMGDRDDAARYVFYQSLRHEVQHAADRYQGRELSEKLEAAKGKPVSEKFHTALRLYKTEYRAHYYQGEVELDQPSTVPAAGELGLDWSPRQLAVLQRVRDRYQKVAEAWGPTGLGAHPSVMQLAFRREVGAYRDPDTEGFNKFNSLRIDDLYDALERVPQGTSDPDHRHVRTLLGATRRLHVQDADYLLDPRESPMFRAKIEHHLAGPAKSAFWKRVKAHLPPPEPPAPGPPPPPPPQVQADPPVQQDQPEEATIVAPPPPVPEPEEQEKRAAETTA